MTEKPRPTVKEKAAAELAARREREAAALRANLRRRKEQGRAAEQRETSPHPGPLPPAGEGE